MVHNHFACRVEPLPMPPPSGRYVHAHAVLSDSCVNLLLVCAQHGGGGSITHIQVRSQQELHCVP
jgi:hypothetical protein